MPIKKITQAGWGRKAAAAGLLALAAHAAHAWTVIVNDAGDTTGDCATSGTGSCTLRDAFIYASNHSAVGGDNRIEFNIGGGGEHAIKVGSVGSTLPKLPAPVAPARSLTIDATTQPGYANNTPRRPLITIEGRRSGPGISITSNTTVRGLSIVEFGQGGIYITGDNNSILDNHVGVNASGTQAPGNHYNIIIASGSGNRIGSLDTDGRNLISGASNGDGIDFSFAGAGKNNIVQGNYIGTDITGEIALGNSHYGVAIYEEHEDVLIDSNLFADNRWGAIQTQGTRGIVVTNNRMGTNAAGSATIGSQKFGVSIDFTGKSGHQVRNNQFAGHNEAAVVTNGNAGGRNPGLVVSNNLIGLSADGSTVLPNYIGILLKSTDGATIQDNTVVGTRQSAIQLQGDSRDNVIKGNRLGLNSDDKPMHNLVGISMWQNAKNNTVENNVIAHSQRYGIALFNKVQGATIVGNSIYENNGAGIAMSAEANLGHAEPELTMVTEDDISGKLQGAANEQFRIEYFASAHLSDGSTDQYAAKKLLGAQTVTTDASGHADLKLDVAVPPRKAASVSAIATRMSTRDSSRISKPMAVANKAPQALEQNLQTEQDKPLPIVLSGSDPDGDTLRFAIATQPQHGSLMGLDPATGALTYQPAAGYVGPDSFSFIVNDGEDDSTPATVNITVNKTQPPVVPPRAAVPVPGLQPGTVLLLTLLLAGLAAVRRRA